MSIKNIFLVLVLVLFLGCKKEQRRTYGQRSLEQAQIKHAKGFSVSTFDNYTQLVVNSPWPEAEEPFTYILSSDISGIPDSLRHYRFIKTPVKSIVVTSTTHIPALEALEVSHLLTGFPGTQYISSPTIRERIDEGSIKELGVNENLNTEILIEQQPDLVVGFSINSNNKTYNTIEKSGIPVVYNGDWTEQTPLGKAEWIKFFAPFFNKEIVADSIFDGIVKEYEKARNIASTASTTPTVLSGAMYKDVWYMPGGDSWAAQFLLDANANYLWKNAKGTGSISLSFEPVLEKAFDAQYWIGPAQFTSYSQMLESNEHYSEFNAFKNKQVYTFSSVTGATGGLLYYELAPNRPDLVLKDLIKILHPELLNEYEPYFFKPVKD